MMWTIREQTRHNRKWLLLGLKDRPGWKDSRLHAEMRAASAQTAAVRREGREASRLLVASNSELLRQAAQLPEKRQDADPGSSSFSHSLLCSLKELVRSYKPTRFEEKWLRKRRSKACGEWDHNPTTGLVNESFYVDAIRDPTSWRSVMDQVESLFRTSATRQVTLSEGHELYDSIHRLVPWEIAKIQVARAPAARRLPTGFPYTHRATITLYVDDTLVVETEDLANIVFPRQKFSKAVKYGIMVYGNAPEDEAPAQEEEVEVPQEMVRGAEITFPQCGVSKDIKRAVARLHVNLPTSTDLVRMLAFQGSITPQPQALAAAKKLRCASCERMRQQPRPRPSRVVSYMGQLNDLVQVDLFYARDVTGANHVLMGMIDTATNLQQVRLLPDRSARTCLEAFREMWVRPYGTPLKVLLDQDGSFQGEMWEWLVRAGVETEYVPAEAHYKLGKAERNNAIFREVLNRTADATGASNAEEMTERGRNDGSSGLLHPRRQLDADEHQHRLRSLIFRAEAQKAVADVNVDTHVRRALLRKTAHTKVDDLPPGAKVAVWRSQLRGRSAKKRGGYVIGRLVTWDGNCGWVQIGWQTVKVDRAQMRPAVGFENWTPEPEDIRALKQAGKSFFEGEVEDQREEGPPEDLVPEVSQHEDEMFMEQAQEEPHADMLLLPEAIAGFQRSSLTKDESADSRLRCRTPLSAPARGGLFSEEWEWSPGHCDDASCRSSAS